MDTNGHESSRANLKSAFSADSNFPRFNTSTLQRIKPASSKGTTLTLSFETWIRELWGKTLIQKTAPWIRTMVQWIVSRRKMMRLFLIGMLFGVIITAAVTYVFAIPANNYYWRMEIWKRGGAAWTFDKNGHFSWMWTVEPISHTPSKKRAIVPSSDVKVRTERL